MEREMGITRIACSDGAFCTIAISHGAPGATGGELSQNDSGTGGLSHQISGPRAGLINSEWDQRFLDNLTADPHGLTRIPHLDYMREAGAEGIEMIMWLIMRGALDDHVDEI
jgi:hypothetical protein